MANYFDQFDAPKSDKPKEAKSSASNYFDRFDKESAADQIAFDSVTKGAEGIRNTTPAQSIAGNPVTRFAIGAADPLIGLWQMQMNVNPMARYLGIPQAANEHLASLKGMIDQGRNAQGSEGFDWTRLAGNVLAPASMAAKVPVATGVGGRAGIGAVAGGIGGATNPVEDSGESFTDFALTKAKQIGLGTLAGGALGPVVGFLGDKLAPVLSKMTTDSTLSGARRSMEADKIIEKALKDVNRESGAPIDPNVMQGIRGQVMEALKEGKTLDAAALIRKADFDALKIQPTLGQLTRDGSQFARERNLRAVPDVGAPLLTRFQGQNQELSKLVGGYGGDLAGDVTQASNTIAGALKSTDTSLRNKVGALYDAARQSEGRDLEIPLQGLSQSYQTVLKDFGKVNVPQAIRQNLEQFGLTGGKQTRPFTMNDAEQVIQQINGLYDPMKKAEAAALDQLRNAVKGAINEADVAGGPFAAARTAASKRFQLHDAVPALDAAASGRVSPDLFVQRFVIGGTPSEVKNLSDLLQRTSPEAFNEARNQIGAVLQRAAFGENPAGDKLIRPESLAKAIRNIGEDKLRAFYSAEEIAQLHRISRVGAFINSPPAASPVLNNPNMFWAGPMMGMLGKIPGVPAAASLLGAAQRTISQNSDVSKAMNAAVPVLSENASPETAAILSSIFGPSVMSAGVLAGRGAR